MDRNAIIVGSTLGATAGAVLGGIVVSTLALSGIGAWSLLGYPVCLVVGVAAGVVWAWWTW